jgi:hypothetical protein
VNGVADLPQTAVIASLQMATNYTTDYAKLHLLQPTASCSHCSPAYCPQVQLGPIQAHLQWRASEHDAPLAAQMLEGIDGLVAAGGLEPVALVTHQHITQACQRPCVLTQRFIAAAAQA